MLGQLRIYSFYSKYFWYFRSIFLLDLNLGSVFYDYPEVIGKTIDDPYDAIPDSNLCAIDNITYDWLVKEFGKKMK